MKYCIMANLQFSVPTLRSHMSQVIKEKIVDKITDTILKSYWGDFTLADSTSEEGKPSNNLTIRFDKEADMNELFDLIKDKMIKLPVLKGSLSKHYCYHDENNTPCVLWENVACV